MSVAASLVVATVVAPFARAAEPTKPYRLVVYRAHAGCPSSSAFAAAVGRRLGGAALDESARLGLEIEIVRKGATSHGALVADDGALRTVREVDAQTCDDVVEALALIATIAIENAAASAVTPEPAAPEPVAPEPVAPEPVAPEPTKDEDPTPGDAPSPPAPADRPSVTAEPARAPTKIELRPSFGVGVLGAALSGFATTTAFMGSFGLEIGRGAGLSPAVFVAFGRTPEHTISGIDAAHARWTWARLDACPHVVTPSATTKVTACATFGAGVIEASARAFDEVAPVRRPWYTVGALARLTTWFGPVGQGIELGAEVPLRRDRLVAEVRGGEARVPPVVPVLGLFLALRIP